jgi:hypothetical protein
MSPMATQMSNYQPPQTATASCHSLVLKKEVDTFADISADQNISAIVPTKPIPRLCECMVRNTICRANPDTTLESNIVFNRRICKERGSQFCDAVNINSTEGRYGIYNFCNVTEIASWLLDKHYRSMANDTSACSINGGIIQTPVPTPSRATDCDIFLRQAGVDGLGTITSIPPIATNKPSGSQASGSSLSAGAKAGIGVSMAVLAGGLLLAGLFIRSRRRKIKTRPMSADELKAELPADSIARHEKMEQLDGAEIVELSGPDAAEVNGYSVARAELNGMPKAVELNGNSQPVELPANDGLNSLKAPQKRE